MAPLPCLASGGGRNERVEEAKKKKKKKRKELCHSHAGPTPCVIPVSETARVAVHVGKTGLRNRPRG